MTQEEFLQARIEAMQKEIQELQRLVIYTGALANKHVSEVTSARIAIGSAKKCIEDGDWFLKETYDTLDLLTKVHFNQD